MSTASARTKRATSERLIDVFFWASIIGFPLLAVALVAALFIPLYVVALPEKMLTAKLTFTSVGLLFGIFQVFVGVLLAMIGVTIEYDVDAKLGPATVKLASASPGLLLLVLGNVLFAFSLMRQFEVSETVSKPIASESAAQTAPSDQPAEPDPLQGVGGPE
jgi:hypothetical protein